MGYRYLGSKARIAEDIVSYAGKTTDHNGYFIDAFCGTGVVAEKAADLGWKILINDMMKNATIMSEARLISVEDVSFDKLGGYVQAIAMLNNLSGVDGYIWREYSPASKEICGIERKYFTEENAKKIDAITAQIHRWYKEKIISRQEWVLLLSNLITATNDVANIAGTYGCFLSKWNSNANKQLLLNVAVLRPNKVDYVVQNQDVFSVESTENDIVYLDPPYTKRQYAAYYHIHESIVCGDEPNVKGISGLRPWKDKASVFCYKTKALPALIDLITQQKAKRVLLSYSNEGHIDLTELQQCLSKYGSVNVIELGSIGRYRPNRVAVSNNSKVQEYLIDFRCGENNEQNTNR